MIELPKYVKKASGRYCYSCCKNKPKESFKGRKCDDCEVKYGGKRIAAEAAKAVA